MMKKGLFSKQIQPFSWVLSFNTVSMVAMRGNKKRHR